MTRLLALLAVVIPLMGATQLEDITCETTATTGTGTVNLAGALTNYLAFATTITSGSSVQYSIVSGNGQVETGTGTFTDAAPDTLTRVATWSSGGAGVELTLTGTSQVCVTLTTDITFPGDPGTSDFVTGWNETTNFPANKAAGTGLTADADSIDLDTPVAVANGGTGATSLTDLIALTTMTTGVYVAQVADGTGVDGTANAEGATYTPSLDLTELNTFTLGAGAATGIIFDAGATDPAIETASGTFTIDIGGTNETVLNATNFSPGANDGNALGVSGTAWADLFLAAGGLIEFDGGTTNSLTCTGGNCTIEGNGLYRVGGTDVAVADGGTGASTLTDLITLTTMTTGVYVAQVADGTGIDGTANAEGATYTPTLDLTEMTTATWGVNNFTTEVFSTDGVDITLDFSTTDAFVTVSGGGTSPGIAMDDAGAIRFLEEDAGGANYKAFVSPSTVSADTTCTFEDDANFIPDSCVGDGSDDDVPEVGDFAALVGGSGVDNNSGTIDFDATEITSLTWGANNFTTQTFSTDGVDISLDFTTTDAFITIAGGGTSPGIAMDDAGAIRFLEEDASGANYKAFVSPGTVSADTTCTFEDDANFIPDSCVGDGSDDDVPEVGDFTALVGGSGIDNNSGTLDFDATEISSATWGAGAFTTFTFDAGATDPLITFGSGTILMEGLVSLRQADAANAGGQLKWLEDPGTGSNFIAFAAPAAITTDATCTFENDANPIPDSCVGDGSDAGGGIAGSTGATDNSVLRADGTGGATLQNSPLIIADTSGAISGAGSGFSIEFFGASGTDTTLTAPSAGNLTIEGNAIYRAGGTDVAVADGGTGASTLNDLITLTTMTTGVYVAQVADGTGIDGTANAEGATYTPTLDLTEVNSAVWGAGAFTTHTFSGAGAIDITFDFATTNQFQYTQADAGAAGPIMSCYHNSASPAAADIICEELEQGEDNAGNTQTYSMQKTTIDDPNNTGPSEDGTRSWGVVTAGTVAYELTLRGDALFPVANDGLALGISGTAFADLFLASGGTIEWDGGTTNTMTCTGGNCTIEGNTMYRAGGTDVAVADGGTGASSLTDLITLTTHTQGNYVGSVADGTGVDGTAAGEGATYTPTLDFTEITSVVWGASNFTTEQYSTDGVDFTWDYTTTDGVMLLTGGGSSPTVALDDDPTLQFLEEDGGGSNFLAFSPPAAITTSQTCTFEDDASFIPDACVGDGSDASGAPTEGTAIDVSGSTVNWDPTEVNTVTWGAGSFTTMTWDAGASDPTATFGSGTITWSNVTAYSLGTSAAFTTGTIELGAASDTTVARSAAGEATLEGDALKHAGRQTVYFPAASCTPNVTNGADYSSYDSGSNDLTVVTADFDTGATEERIDCSIALPKAWNESTVTAQFYWTNTAGASSSVVWDIACASISDDDTLNTAMGTSVTVTDAWIATNDLHITAETSAITCSGTPAENDFVQVRILRDTSNASDAMAGDARLLGFKLYYTDNASSDD